MTIYELIQRYGRNKGEQAMWNSIKTISDELEQCLTHDDHDKLLKRMYCIMTDGHYDEWFADHDVKHMYYTDAHGEKHHAPYLTKEEVKYSYTKNRAKIPAYYNVWDFYVTVQMIYSDNITLLQTWFTGIPKEELNEKVIDLAINWLHDEDNPFGESKIWGYFNK